MNKSFECTAIWLRRIGYKVQVLAELKGKWHLVVEEQQDGIYSHIAEGNGSDNWPKDPLMDYENDPNVTRAHEKAQEFIRKHPNVPVVDVPEVSESSDAPPSSELNLPCLACGKPKNDSTMHHDAPGTNWGAALHWFEAPPSDAPEAAEVTALIREAIKAHDALENSAPNFELALRNRLSGRMFRLAQAIGDEK